MKSIKSFGFRGEFRKSSAIGYARFAAMPNVTQNVLHASDDDGRALHHSRTAIASSSQPNYSSMNPFLQGNPTSSFSEAQTNAIVSSKLSSSQSSSHESDRESTGAHIGGVEEFESLEEGDKIDRISSLQAGWNVTNAIQGMFIVSFPYAVVQGGYLAVLSMIVIAYICCHTGNILVELLYETNPITDTPQRVRDSYMSIAEAAWGRRFGARIVNVAQLIELCMTCILYLVLCGDMMVGSFPNAPVSLSGWIVICSLFILPCALLRNLHHVSWLSFWCTVAHMIINAIILIFCLTRASEWQWGKIQLRVDMWTFPISLGIVVFSYTSQIFLPTLEGNMIKRSEFRKMMFWTHLAAAIFKALFALVGFVTFGDETSEIITNNLPRTLKIAVNLVLVAKALLSYPLPYYAAVQLVESSVLRSQIWPFSSIQYTTQDGALDIRRLALRFVIILCTLLLAIFIPHFAILMGLIGSFTGTMLSFIWPCWFHMKLRWTSLSRLMKAIDMTIILIGAFSGLFGIYYSAHALARAFRGLQPNPSALPILQQPPGNDTLLANLHQLINV